MRRNRIVPVAMKRVAGQVDGGRTEIGDLDPFGMFVFVELSAHLEAGFGCRRGDQLNDRAIAARDIRLLRQQEQIASDSTLHSLVSETCVAPLGIPTRKPSLIDSWMAARPRRDIAEDPAPI